MTKRILLVDNNKEYRQTVARKLQLEGFEVEEADSPDQAKRVLKRLKIDLVIIDLRLINDEDSQDNSGFLLARQLEPALPKIMLTNIQSPLIVQQALRHGIEGKPLLNDVVVKSEISSDGRPSALLLAISNVLKNTQDQEAVVHNEVTRLVEGQVTSPEIFTINVGKLLADQYNEALRRVKLYAIMRLILIVLGALIVFSGGIAAIFLGIQYSIVSLVAGMFTLTIERLFSKSYLEKSEQRRDQHYQHLLELYKENLNHQTR